jgi:hypothetical protein
LKTWPTNGDERPGQEPASPRELLAQTLRDLADDPSDLGALLRGLALALQIASTEYSVDRREVWNYQEREAYRSRVTWEAWILHRKFPHGRDLK